MSDNTTLPKMNYMRDIMKKSQKEDLYKLVYEFFHNYKYNNSTKTFLHILKNDNKIEAYYAYDKSCSDINKINNLLSLKSSLTGTSEIAHHGDGFKKFTYFHNGTLEVFIKQEDNTYIYLKQKHKKIWEYINGEGSYNTMFEKKLDTSDLL